MLRRLLPSALRPVSRIALSPSSSSVFSSASASASSPSFPLRAAVALRASTSASLTTRSYSTSHISRATKMTTGIAGLPVVPNAREVLISLYIRTIEQANAYTSAGGRNYNDQITILSKYRLDICEQNDQDATIENLIQCGQMEELILQAEEELELLTVVNTEFKPWETNWDADYKEYTATHHGAFGDGTQHIRLFPTKDGFTTAQLQSQIEDIDGTTARKAAEAKAAAEAEAAAAKAAAEAPKA